MASSSTSTTFVSLSFERDNHVVVASTAPRQSIEPVLRLVADVFGPFEETDVAGVAADGHAHVFR